MDLKKTNAPVNTITYNKSKLEEPTGNIYEAITIMSKRANQINTEIKKEFLFVEFDARLLPTLPLFWQSRSGALDHPVHLNKTRIRGYRRP